MTEAKRAHYHPPMTASIPNKILVVDDDQRLRDLLRRYLAEQGFNVFLAENATSMNKLWTRERFDLLVLDLMLPGDDGLAICRKLRGSGDNTPIIMLTARGDEVDRIIGLELGADDYLPKPFNPRELVARIHAVLRRRTAPEAPGAPAAGRRDTSSFGPYDPQPADPHADEGRPVEGAHDGRVRGDEGLRAASAPATVAREIDGARARGREYEVFDRSLDVQISRLRKLIEPDPVDARATSRPCGDSVTSSCPTVRPRSR